MAASEVQITPTEAVQFGAASVGGSATVIVPSTAFLTRSVAVSNNGSATVFLGDSTVAAATGFPLAAGASMAFDLNVKAAPLYGITAGSTVDVRWIAIS